MSDFDRHWRRLVRAASGAGAAPVPHAPDGARLQRRAAAAAGPVPRPWRQPLPSAVAIALLWAVALPAAQPAWHGAREVLARLAVSAPVRACCPALPSPPVPSTAPALASPQLPPPPDLWPRLRSADPPTDAPPKETPS